MNNKYNMTNTTLKELEQNVSRLKITNHENKNQLLTIRNMIKKGEDSDKIIKHIEKIVDKTKPVKQYVLNILLFIIIN